MKHRLLVLIVALVLAPLAILARNYDVSVTDASPETALQAIKKPPAMNLSTTKGCSPALTTARSPDHFTT